MLQARPSISTTVRWRMKKEKEKEILMFSTSVRFSLFPFLYFQLLCKFICVAFSVFIYFKHVC
jgi:hypothetical protein